MFSDFIKSVLPFSSTTVITFGFSYVVGQASIVDPGVVVLLLSLNSFLRFLPYTGQIVVFSISSVSFSRLSSNTGVLLLLECSAAVFSSSCSFCANLPSLPLGFSPLRDRGIWNIGCIGSLTRFLCNILFVSVNIVCFVPTSAITYFRIRLYFVFFFRK